MKKELSYEDIRVYDFIVSYISENGYPPSYREIALKVGRADSMIIPVLWKLESFGKIKMKPKTPRAIKVIGYEFVKV
ncbi:MAG: hypothetical protein PHW34_07640 [Hespellia sp.]|nr:hypothetical protein [Hespellia sp.]